MSMTFKSIFSSLAAACVTGGCETTPSIAPQAALLAELDEKTQNEITAVIQTALNGTRVFVSAERLKEKSTLVIDPAGAGNPITGGRIMGLPDHFDLKMSGKECFLEHRKTGQTYPLKSASCRPIH